VVLMAIAQGANQACTN